MLCMSCTLFYKAFAQYWMYVMYVLYLILPGFCPVLAVCYVSPVPYFTRVLPSIGCMLCKSCTLFYQVFAQYWRYVMYVLYLILPGFSPVLDVRFLCPVRYFTRLLPSIGCILCMSCMLFYQAFAQYWMSVFLCPVRYFIRFLPCAECELQASDYQPKISRNCEAAASQQNQRGLHSPSVCN